jgi:hypothetical protein
VGRSGGGGEQPHVPSCCGPYPAVTLPSQRAPSAPAPKDPCETAECGIPGTLGICTADMTASPPTYKCGTGCKPGYTGRLCSNCTADYTKVLSAPRRRLWAVRLGHPSGPCSQPAPFCLLTQVGIGKYAKCVCPAGRYIKEGACAPCRNGTTSAASDSTTCSEDPGMGGARDSGSAGLGRFGARGGGTGESVPLVPSLQRPNQAHFDPAPHHPPRLSATVCPGGNTYDIATDTCSECRAHADTVPMLHCDASGTPSPYAPYTLNVDSQKKSTKFLLLHRLNAPSHVSILQQHGNGDLHTA